MKHGISRRHLLAGIFGTIAGLEAMVFSKSIPKVHSRPGKSPGGGNIRRESSAHSYIYNACCQAGLGTTTYVYDSAGNLLQIIDGPQS